MSFQGLSFCCFIISTVASNCIDLNTTAAIRGFYLYVISSIFTFTLLFWVSMVTQLYKRLPKVNWILTVSILLLNISPCLITQIKGLYLEYCFWFIIIFRYSLSFNEYMWIYWTYNVSHTIWYYKWIIIA